MPGGAHHGHVAQSLIEDDLGRDPAVGAAEHHGVGCLRGGQAGPALDALAGMLRPAGDERSLPSLSAFQAVTGFELGMVDIVPPGRMANAMTISAAELLGWDDIARRDLPWRNPGITAWQILVSEFMLAQTPAARWPTPSATAATSVATCCGPGASWAHVGVLGSDHRLALVQPFQRRAHRRRRPHRTDHDAGLSGQRQDRPPLPAAVPRNPHRATAGADRAPTVRQVTGWLTRNPDRLTEDDRPRLNWDSHAYANGERSLLQPVPAAGRMPENK